ncbi:hypothetical protein HDU79_010213 [Rhizoclosmatium sp. JEL0117]|nr:hypothetical protein HDU79_010213 [Rhizoclosmatium sp. JEL0117]
MPSPCPAPTPSAASWSPSQLKVHKSKSMPGSAAAATSLPPGFVIPIIPLQSIGKDKPLVPPKLVLMTGSEFVPLMSRSVTKSPLAPAKKRKHVSALTHVPSPLHAVISAESLKESSPRESSDSLVLNSVIAVGLTQRRR